MKEFLSAAFPLVLAGFALAVLAASCGTKERRGQIDSENIAMGACLGLLLGVALNYCGLWENHAIGFALGPLWGMALGASAESILEHMVEEQKTDVDAVTGATNSSKVIRKAVENALDMGKEEK